MNFRHQKNVLNSCVRGSEIHMNRGPPWGLICKSQRERERVSSALPPTNVPLIFLRRISGLTFPFEKLICVKAKLFQSAILCPIHLIEADFTIVSESRKRARNDAAPGLISVLVIPKWSRKVNLDTLGTWSVFGEYMWALTSPWTDGPSRTERTTTFRFR